HIEHLQKIAHFHFEKKINKNRCMTFLSWVVVSVTFNGWIYYQSSFYYMSNETRSWTESRRYCKESGADLIIINNREENKMFGGTSAYIGLTDSDVEARWKWVDGTNMTSGLWGPGEPNGYIKENCGVVVDNDPRWPTLFGWHDVLCNRDLQWICEKRISQLILP
uniref:C-type lectin domain-containing protein n=1 Tax=Sinocyclocheilus rhinocerous TaxID=307959 RepID=A0A673K2W0_9TELE